MTIQALRPLSSLAIGATFVLAGRRYMKAHVYDDGSVACRPEGNANGHIDHLPRFAASDVVGAEEVSVTPLDRPVGIR